MQSIAKMPWVKAILTLLAVAVATGLSLGFHALGVADAGLVLTLLMAVVLCSWAFGLPYSVLSSAAAILAHSFFFSVPIYSFEVTDPQHLIAFVFLVAVGLVVSRLSAQLRDRVERLAVREGRLEALHRVTLSLSDKIDRPSVVRTSETLLSEILGGRVSIFDGAFPPATGTRAFALSGSQRAVGWLVYDASSGPDPFDPERRVWIETLLSPVALALERVELIQEQQDQSRHLEATETRNTILHGISHDLRTPLTVISATAGSLLERTDANDPRRADLESLAGECQAVVQQVENLLELTSLTSGSVTPRLEWVPIEDLVFPCLQLARQRFPALKTEAHVEQESALCHVDETLVMKALSNLLENAALYAVGPISVRTLRFDDHLRFEVSDRGPGVPASEKASIFGQFVRGGSARRASGHRGSGLGLALVQSVAELHGGAAGVDDREGGGSTFWFELRQQEPVPNLWGSAP